MKRVVSGFFLRGLVGCGFGPLALVLFYLILSGRTGVQTLTVREVCAGILSLSALAFLSGGMNVVYQIERLPLAVAIGIHGGVLYAGYLATYLVNGWLEGGITPILVFTAIFAVGYLAIWAVIYCMNRTRTARLNQQLRQSHPGK